MNKEDIAEVRSRANILEVVSEHVTMKRSGVNYSGLCPFHDEKGPSFSVRPDKGFFYCFGCHEKGDVFAFLMKKKGIEFPDAVRELAHKYGVQLVETVEQKVEYDKRTHILMLYQQASQYFSQLLKDPTDGVIARDYLEKRGIPEEIIDRFKIGYAGPTWDGLLSYLTSSTKVAPATLEEAGLVRRKADTNSYYDLFRNRLMIPICDDQGRVIAFGGRTLANDDAKYVNSPETPIYTKGRHLYAFNLAKETIKAQDAVIVVEGYFDAITPHQFGFTNTVATLGTALTEVQARSLVRYTESKRVYLAFDADPAGIKAVERGVETLKQVAEGVGIELRVIRIPGAKDPDECLRAPGGPEAFAHAIATAPLIVDYQLEQSIEDCDISTHAGKIEAARRLVPILAHIKKDVDRSEYVRQWSLKISIREEGLLNDVAQYRRDNQLGTTPNRGPKQILNRATQRNSLKNVVLEAEMQLLALYLKSFDDYERVSLAMTNDSFLTPSFQIIKEAIDSLEGTFKNVEELQNKLMDILASDKDASAVLIDTILKADELRKQDMPVDLVIKHSKASLLKEKLKRVLTNLSALVGLTENDNDSIALQSKIKQLSALNSEYPSIEKFESLADVHEFKAKIEAAMAAEAQTEGEPILETRA